MNLCDDVSITTHNGMPRLRLTSSASMPSFHHESLARLYRTNKLNDPSSFSAEEIQAVRRGLLEWYDEHRRALPWRGDQLEGRPHVPPSAYGTWISEVMLQQTRVETVIDYWFRWMERFPSIKILAAASPEEVNAQWAGLGYYRRAAQILACAQQLQAHHGGALPDNTDALLKLPGIGPYTAGAIASIAFGRVAGVVDGNVLRVLSRLRALDAPLPSSGLDKACWALVSALVDPVRPGHFNQALMELGATLCSPTSPRCHLCPVQPVCRAHRLVHLEHAVVTDDKDADSDNISKHIEDIEDLALPLPLSVTEFPKKVPKKAPKDLLFAVCVLKMKPPLSSASTPCSEEMKYLLVRRPEKGLLQNQWEFPSALQSSETIPSGYESLPYDKKVQFWLPLCQEYLQSVLGIQMNQRIDLAHTQLQPPAPVQCLLHTEHLTLHPQPIVHIFSHQRHIMYILEATFDPDFCVAVARNDCSTTAADIKTVIDIKTNTETDTSAERNFSLLAPWRTSAASGSREVAWLTLAQLQLKGVTSGVQKVIALTASATLSDHNDNDNDKKKKKSERNSQKSKSKIKSCDGNDVLLKKRKITQFFKKK